MAVELSTRYFEGQLTPMSEMDDNDVAEEPPARVVEAAEKVSLLEENVEPRANLPPLLVHLRERRAERLHYIGVSFGLTLDLFRFWRKHKFAPFYIGQIPNAVTGEHTCMVIKPLNNSDIEADNHDQWGFFGPFYQEFKQRFILLLSSDFRSMDILDPRINFAESELATTNSNGFLTSIKGHLSAHNMKRLKSYTDNRTDFLQGQMKLEGQQIMCLLIEVMRNFHKYLYGVASKEIESSLPRLEEVVLRPHRMSMDEDLNEAAKQVKDDRKAKTDGLLDPELHQQFSIVGRDTDFENAVPSGVGKIPSSGFISIKSRRSTDHKHGRSKSGKKRSKEDRGSKSNKKKKS